MAADVVVPFYVDWKFWSFIVSFSALIISLLPQLKRFKPAKLECDVYQKIFVTHKVGNPNAQLHVLLTNTGGKKLRIKGMELNFKRTGENIFSLDAMSYRRVPSDTTGILMTSFRVLPGEEWEHLVDFFSNISKLEQNTFKTFQRAIHNNIIEKRTGLPMDNPAVEVDAAHLEPALSYFEKKFKWLSGEYEVSLRILTDANFVYEKKLRMTLFETDSKELESAKDMLKYGTDIINNQAPGLTVDLVERI